MSTTPHVLLITFNRPDLTEKVLEAIAQAKPSQLFISSDGPRDSVKNDRRLVSETRALVEKMVTWPCNIHTLFQEENLGCRQAVLDAVDWFFGYVEEGIILEDDSVPHPDFFPYCSELLDKYRDADRVWAILGDNSLKVKARGGASYDFFKYSIPFGAFATWKRSWIRYDRDLIAWRDMRSRSQEKQLWPDRVERAIQTKLLDELSENPRQVWDYQWSFSCQATDSVTIYPKTNLITNIGFSRDDSTHTKGGSLRAGFPSGPIMPLVHPSKVSRNKAAERQALNGRMFGADKYRWHRGIQLWWRTIRKFLVSLRPIG